MAQRATNEYFDAERGVWVKEPARLDNLTEEEFQAIVHKPEIQAIPAVQGAFRAIQEATHQGVEANHRAYARWRRIVIEQNERLSQ